MKPLQFLISTLPALALGAAVNAFGTTPPAWESSGDLAWRREAGSVALLRNGQVIWQFNFGADATKPHFHPVAVPDGSVLTWDKPADHVWHRGLWFAWKFLNGANYWEEGPANREQRGLTEWDAPRIETRPDFSARIALDLRYRVAGAPPVVTERRVVSVSPPGADGGYQLDWEMVFTASTGDVRLDRTPLPGEPGGVAHGGYAGLSVRLAQGLQAERVLTEAGPVEFTAGRFRGRARAMDYSSEIGGRAAGIAILDAPGNLDSPTPWYAIHKPFHYFSPAVICYRPHTLKAGATFALRYRVVAHPGRWDAGQLRAVAEQFSRSKP